MGLHNAPPLSALRTVIYHVLTHWNKLCPHRLLQYVQNYVKSFNKHVAIDAITHLKTVTPLLPMWKALGLEIICKILCCAWWSRCLASVFRYSVNREAFCCSITIHSCRYIIFSISLSFIILFESSFQDLSTCQVHQSHFGLRLNRVQNAL